MFDKRLEKIEENNLILKTLLRVKANSLIVEIENLTPDQLKNKTILESYIDSLNSVLLFINEDRTKEKELMMLQEKLQIKVLSLELDDIGSHKPPVAIIKDNSTHEV